jgi:hypothetical protein
VTHISSVLPIYTQECVAEETKMDAITGPGSKMLAIVLIPLLSSGCSLIGFGIGAVTDSANRWTPGALPSAVDSLSPGEELRVRTRDSVISEGTFLGKGLGPDNHYSQRFEAWRASRAEGNDSIPHFGVSIEIVAQGLKRELLFRGTFAGFDPGVIRIESPRGDGIKGVKLEFVNEVRDSLAERLAGKEVLTRIVSSGVPCASDLVAPSIFIAGSPKSSIPLDEITKLEVAVSGNAKWVGLGIGAGVDIIVGAIAVAAFTTSFHLH